MTLFPGVGEVPHGGCGALPGQGLDSPEARLWWLSGQADPGSRGAGHPPLPRLSQQQPGSEDGRVTEILVNSEEDICMQCFT